MRIVILDDKKENISFLKQHIHSLYTEWLSEACYTDFELVTTIYDVFKGDVELILIHVKEKQNYIEMAQSLQECFPHIRIIFYSEKTDCAEDIFKTVPLYFLKLPFRIEALNHALERVKKSCTEDTIRSLLIHSRGQTLRIRYSSILYIESLGRKLLIYADCGMYETYMKVDEVLSKLPPQFKQCHRSYIVNMERIEQYSSQGLLLASDKFVPLSKTYRNVIKETIC